jgi:hypothetical protein
LYPLLMVSPIQALQLRKRWWRCLGELVMVATAFLVVVSRSRPLFPAQTLIAQLQARHPQSRFVSRMAVAYNFRNAFAQEMALFENSLPRDERVVGYATLGGLAEVGLWRPLGQRQVLRVLSDDSPARIREAGVRYVVVDDAGLLMRPESIQGWMTRFRGELVDRTEIHEDPYTPAVNFYLVRLSN